MAKRERRPKIVIQRERTPDEIERGRERQKGTRGQLDRYRFANSGPMREALTPEQKRRRDMDAILESPENQDIPLD